MVTRNKKEAPETRTDTLLTEERLARYEGMARACAQIDPQLYRRYNVKRGLRNEDGSGVLVGVTRVGSIHELVPVPGKQFYRGMDVQELVHGFQSEGRPGFEETAYLLLFGKLPNKSELEEWNAVLDSKRALPYLLLEKIIREPSRDIMNSLARSVLAAYSDDETPDAVSIPAVLRQSIDLVARFSAISSCATRCRAARRRRTS